MKKLSLYFAIFGAGILAFAMSAHAQSWTLDTTLGSDSAYSISGEGEQNFSDPANYQLDIDTDKLAGKHTTFSFDNSAGTATGSMTVKLPSGNRTLYYTYTQPADYETVTKGLYQNIAADGTNVQNKTFTINHNESTRDAGIFYLDYNIVTNLPSVFVNSDFVARANNYDEYSSSGIIFVSRVILGGIDGDFIGNWSYSGNGSNDTYGGGIQLISLNDNIGSIRGDFINNYVAGAQYVAHGGAILNNATIGSIEGNFIQNHINTEGQTISAGALGYGGAIANRGTMGNIKGNFVGNYIYTNFPQAFGGAIHNNGTIGDIEGDFIGNWVYAKGTTPRDQGNGDVYGGAIYINTDSSIGKIKGDFIANFVSGTTNAAQGGAIWAKNGNFDSIESNFIANYAYAANSTNVAGGAIYTVTGINLENITGEFLGNYVYGKTVYGGAIANRGTMTLENSALKDNYAKAVGNGTARGGAIWSINTMTLSATDGFDFEIKGNYVENDSGRKYEAIYMASQTIAGANPYVYSNLNLNATNSGTFTIYDNINGAGGYRFFNDGDGTGKVDMYGFIDGTSSFKTNNIDFHYHQLDGELTTTRFNAFNIDSDTSHFYYYIDVDANTEKADMIKSNVTNTGRVILNGINLMGADWSSLDSDFIAQVLDVPTDAMQLALSPDLQDMTNEIISSSTVSETDTVQANTDWSKVFKSREGSVVVRAGLGLATTKTTNDSIGFTISTDTNITETVLGEPLVMVAQDTTNPVKTFSTSNTNAVYTLGNVVDVDGVGEVKGNLTVRGKIGWNSRSTLDLNNKMGFVLNDADSVLTLSSMTIKNGHATNHTQSSVAYVNNGRLYVDNVIFKNNVSEGGSILSMHSHVGQLVSVVNSRFENNQTNSRGTILLSALDAYADVISNSEFVGNQTTDSNGAGGAISVECGGVDLIANSLFTSNSASYAGGAILDGYQAYIGEIKNSSFYNNHAGDRGGAIWSYQDLTISANNGSSTFQGNYVGSNVDNNQAIYMDKSTNTLTLSVTNSGTMTFYDYITGAAGYATVVSGDSTSTFNLYNNILYSQVSTSGGFKFNTANNSIFTYDMLSMASDDDTQYTIDIDIANRKSDVFKTTNFSTGVITLSSLNYIGEVDWGTASGTFVIQVISNTNAGSSLRLALSPALSNTLAAYSTNVVVTSSSSMSSPLVMQADNDWEDQFETSTTTTYTTNTFSREIGLVTKDTYNDSIGATVTSAVSSNVVYSTEPAGEPLVLVAKDATNQMKSFTTSNPSAVYTLGYVDNSVAGVGPVSGTLTVSGAGNSTLNLNGKKGFELTNAGSVLHLNNVAVTGAHKTGNGAAVYQTSGTLSINNVAFTSNVASGKGAAIYTSASSTLISANNGRTLFEGNSVGSNDMQAIYVSGAANSLNLLVNNHGTMTFYDYVTGTSGYSTSIGGNDTGVFNLYNNILNSHVSTNGGFSFNTANNSVFTYNLLSLTSDDDTRYTIDVDLAGTRADVFKTSSLSSGVITLADLNYIGGMTFDDVNDNFVLQIISNTNSQSTLQLALSTGLSNTLSAYNAHSESSNTVTTSNVIGVQADNDWADKFGTNTTSTLTTTVYDKTVGLLSTNTENDSIGVTITSSSVSSSVTTYVSAGEPIVLVAQDTTHPVKTFTTDDPNAVYTLGYVDNTVTEIGTVRGTLTVSGAVEGDNRSTLDLNGRGGFVLQYASPGAAYPSATLNLENLAIVNGYSTSHGAVENSGILNVSNVLFASNTGANAGSAIHQSTAGGQINYIRDSFFIDNHATSGGGAIAAGYLIGEIINTYFANNSATTAGGAVSLECGGIDSIASSMFSGNSSGWGGALYVGYHSDMGNIEDSLFTSNSAGFGGAIYYVDTNDTTSFGDIVNTSFVDNHATVYGGAIYSSHSLNIVANNGSSTFQGNYVGTADNKQAIYINNSSATLTLRAVSSGVINLHDYVSGNTGYNTLITGDATGRLNWYNNILNSHVQTSGALTINTANNDLFTYNLLTLNSSADTSYIIDIDVTQKMADLFETTNFSSGTITLTGFNVISGDFADVTDPEFKIQVIKNNDLSSTLQLALGTTIPGSEFAIGTAEIEGSPDAIKANTEWTDIYYRNDVTRTIYGTLGLATTDTHNDSIGVVVSRTEDETIKTPLGDTLVLVASDTTNPVKTFTTTDAEATYVLGSSHTVAGVGGVEGSLTVSGTTSGDNRSTLDLNNKAGFEVLSTSALRLENVDVINANSSNIGAVNNAGTLNVVNSSFYNNTNNVAGGAINSAQDVNITADNGVSTFQGNYVGTADNKQAIYMSDSSSTLTISAVNGGVVNMHDYVSGVNGYATTLTGNETGTINLYNNILNSVVTTSGPVTVNTANNDLFTYNLLTLNSSADTSYIIDIDVNQKLADLFETTNFSSGTVTLTGFNVISGDFADVTDPEFKVQIIKNNNMDSTLQLALGTTIPGSEFVIGTAEIEGSPDAINADTLWTDIYNRNDINRTTYGTLGLATTDTHNDSIGVVVSRTEDETIKTPLGDTLVLVASDTTNPVKTFTTTDAAATYVLGSSHTVAGVGGVEGSLTVSGTTSGDNRSTLDLNNKAGFEVLSTSALRLENVDVINANSSNIGAVNNAGTLNVVNSSFHNNTNNVAGGAINSAQNVNITADNGVSTFQGNYVGTADNKQAIYMNDASAGLTISAQNDGVVNMHDYVSGESGYSTTLTGNETGTINLYNNVLNSVVSATGPVTINTANNDLFTYNLLTLNSSADTNYIIDIDVNQKLADLFETTNFSSGTVTLAGLNVIAGDFADVSDDGFKIQVINNNNADSSLQLALEADISDHEFLINDALIDSTDDEIQTDTDWEDIYNSTDDTRKTYGRIGLATTNTENDSIGVVITRAEDDTEQNPMGDTLALVSGAEIGDRNFNTSSADSTYVLSDNIGDTAEGTLSINGVADDEQRSTLDMNSMSGFNLDKETTINLNNVEVVNGNGAIISATNSNAEVNLTNVNLVQNQSDEAVISGNANVNITADANTSSFAGNAASNVIYINNADLNLNAQNEGVVVFEDNISGEEYNVNVLGDDSGEVRFNNRVTSIDNFTFDDGAVAALGVNANIGADSMSQVTGADNSTLVVDIAVNKEAKTTSAGLIELVGQLSGDYNVVVRPENDDIYDGAYALFLEAPNDTDSSDENFTVTRVYGNPYMWEAKRNIKETDEGSMWYLALSGTTPSEIIPDPEPEPRPAITPEVIAAIGLHEAALEQNRSVVRNVKGKVDANRYYCNDCNISYDRYWRGRQLNNLWILAQGENANVDAPLDMEANIYDVEAGFDIQSDIHNTLGVFASYRKGDYDFSGKGKPYSSPIGSDIDIDSWLAGLYYRYDRNMNWVFATIFGGIQKADISTDDGVAKFDTDGTQYGASVEVGHSFLLQENLVLDPSLGVYYTQVDFDDATDNVGKKYSWDEIKQLQIELGAKLERQYFRGDIYAKPSVIRTITSGDSVFITGMGKVNDTYEDQTLFRIEVGGRYNFNTSTYGYAWANYTVGSEYDAIAAGLGLNYAW